MNAREWDELAELLEKVVKMPGTWQEKAATAKLELEKRGAEGLAEEFANWFAD